MPVIIDPGDYERWLDVTAQADDVLPMLQSRPVEGMEVAAVNPVVNNARHDAPDCLAPVPPV
jgi:putative SOS response-associated peptidase YedK